ncbi:hypothetical protein EV175_000449 [Coemansia sp. RSA 1933]|nr:hypothetical protein EV175_000449 [Coemansia sp. RSA 1933]
MEKLSNSDMATKELGVGDLPEELLVMILANIDPAGLRTSGQVCRRWRRIVTDERSWKRAFVRRFGREPFEMLATGSVGRGGAKGSGVGVWQSEYSSRERVTGLWAGTVGRRSNSERRMEFNARVGSVDRLVVDERQGWALAVSKASRAAVKYDPASGTVYARKNERRNVVFAMPQLSDGSGIVDDGSRVSAVSTRSDRILWGLESGLCTATHLTRHGELKSRAVAARYHTAPVLDMAGPLDRLAQRSYDWRSLCGARAEGDDLVASASASGAVHVWSDRTGQLQHLLQGVAGTPLVRVTWAEGARYVVAASTAGVVFVWDRQALATAAQPANARDLFRQVPWLSPAPDEYSDGRMAPTFVAPFPGAQLVQAQRVVQLTGDPFGASFVLAVEGRGVWRMSVHGSLLASFCTDHPSIPPQPAQNQPIPITVVVWEVDGGGSKRQQRQSGSSTPNLSTAASASDNNKSNISSNSHVLRMDLTKPQPPLVDSAGGRRLLVVGDATGSLWMFDGDATGESVAALQTWRRIHQRAVSAVDVNAAVVVSAARDGQVLVLDPLSGQTLRAMRCHGGGRKLRHDLRQQRREVDEAPGQLWPPHNAQQRPRERRLDPRFWWVHLPLINERTRGDVYLAQMLAARTSERWARQTQGRIADALDAAALDPDDEVPAFHAWLRVEPALVHSFPTLVADVVAGSTWVAMANGTRIHSCFLTPTQKPIHASPASRLRSLRSDGFLSANIAEELAELRLETHAQRQERIDAHETRAYLDREFVLPTDELGLSPDEQVAYALWLSQQQTPDNHTPASADDATTLSSATHSDQPNPDHFSHLALDDMTEEEQLEYALFLSSTSS